MWTRILQNGKRSGWLQFERGRRVRLPADDLADFEKTLKGWKILIKEGEKQNASEGLEKEK
jgi:hypothetical protein